MTSGIRNYRILIRAATAETWLDYSCGPTRHITRYRGEEIWPATSSLQLQLVERNHSLRLYTYARIHIKMYMAMMMPHLDIARHTTSSVTVSSAWSWRPHFLRELVQLTPSSGPLMNLLPRPAVIIQTTFQEKKHRSENRTWLLIGSRPVCNLSTVAVLFG